MIIVAKSLPNAEPNSDEDEAELTNFRETLGGKGRFAYAWTFNPKGRAVEAIRQEIDRRHHIWLYLIHKDRPRFSRLRMRIIDFQHNQRPVHCPEEWRQYCITEEWCITEFPDWLPIHMWFLVDRIEQVEPPIDVRSFTPFFDYKYRMYGRNYFGFFLEREDC